MRFKIPERVRIGRKWYRIERPPDLHEKYLGKVFYERRLISMSPKKLSHDTREETLLHEATHAILYDMDSTLHSNEAFVKTFAKRLHALLKGLEPK